MTDNQKRELTERIVKWLGGRQAVDIPDWDDNYLRKEHMYYFPDHLSPIPFYPLTSRDDWALVEDEIERRGLWLIYIRKLVPEIGRERTEWSWFWSIRRASPLVCAQAWDQMIGETK